MAFLRNGMRERWLSKAEDVRCAAENVDARGRSLESLEQRGRENFAAPRPAKIAEIPHPSGPG